VIEMADLVLWLVAPDLRAEAPPVTTAPVWHVASKADLGPSATSVDLAVSAATGAGLPALLQRLSAFATELAGPGEPALVSRARDRAALEDAGTALETALQRLDSPELAAEGLRSASHALERLVGRIDAETVLDRLFLSFCIGK
jgi:tRNA modification GTPase